MTILVQNLTNETKQICRFGGTKLFILPNNFITFNCTNSAEVSFWSLQSIKDNSKNGIKVIVDISEINTLTKLRNAGRLPAIGKITEKVETVKDVEKVVETPTTITEVSNKEEIPEFTEVVESEPITEPLEEITGNTIVEDVITTKEEVIEDTIKDLTSEEYLKTLTKEELQNIATEKGISFKKNHSTNTLISLILNDND